MCQQQALLAAQPSEALTSLSGLYAAVFDGSVDLFEDEMKSKVKSTQLKLLMDTASGMIGSLEALKALGGVELAVEEPAASVITDASTAVDASDVALSIQPPSVPLGTAIGGNLQWSASAAVAKPVIILPYSVPCRGRVTSVSIKLGGAPRSAVDAMWFLMLMEVRGNTATIWSGRSVEIDTTLVNAVQVVDLSHAPLTAEAGYHLGLVCDGADVSIACQETAGGVCAYTMSRAPDFSSAGSPLPIVVDTKVTY